MEDFNSSKHIHKITVTDRKSCTVIGVNDVLSFDIHEIILETEQGVLVIKGNDLHVNRLSLDQGEVDVDGNLDSFSYSDVPESMGQKTESLLSRLFR